MFKTLESIKAYNFKRMVFLHCMGIRLPNPYCDMVDMLLEFFDVNQTNLQILGNNDKVIYNKKGEEIFCIRYYDSGNINIVTYIPYHYLLNKIRTKYYEHFFVSEKYNYFEFFIQELTKGILKKMGYVFNQFNE